MQMRKWNKSDFKVSANGRYANEVISQIRMKWQRWSHYNPAPNKVTSVQTNICELGIKSVSEDAIEQAMSQDLRRWLKCISKSCAIFLSEVLHV